MTEPTAIKRLSQGRVQCTVQFSPEETARGEEKALQHMSGHVNIPGFRAGKAPANLVREKVRPEALLEETIRELLDDRIRLIANEHKLLPIIPPRIEATSRDPLTVVITYVERPEVKVKGGDKIKIEKKAHKVDAKDIDRMLNYLLEQYRKTAEVDRAAKDADQVTMDFYGTDKDNKEIPGIRTQNYPVVIGSKTLLPGFEDNLIGMKKGDQKSFTLTFPDKYHAEHLRNMPVTFAVTVTKIEEVALPTLTDAFAKEHGLGESAEGVRKRIEESMIQEEEGIERQRRERELFEAIREATKVDLAPELLEQTLRSLFEEADAELRKQNSTLSDWMTKSGKKPEEIEKDMRDQAQKRLTLRFGVEQLLQDHKIEATDEEAKSILENADAKPGSEEFEQARWQKRVEKLVNQLLA